MRHALSLALQDYEGAMLVVSHDRHLLRVVTDSFLLVDDGKVESFNGDLDDYRQWLLNLKDKQDNSKGKTKADENALSRKENRRVQAEKRRLLQPLRQQVKKHEKTIEELSLRKAEIENMLAQTDIYQEENKQKLQILIKEQSQVVDKLIEVEDQWLIMSEQLDAEEM